MANRTRSIVLRVPVTAQEREMIDLKMQQMGTRCFSVYARKMLIDGYYVDMVFYNKPLRAYVLIELKTVKLLPEAVGQLNMYLNYYAAEVNDPDDNPPIGIILCTDKTNVEAEYALGGLSNNIFASRYTYVIPNKEELIAQVEAVLREWHEPEADGEKED